MKMPKGIRAHDSYESAQGYPHTLVQWSGFCTAVVRLLVDHAFADSRSTVDLETARMDLALAVSRSTVDLETARVDFALL